MYLISTARKKEKCKKIDVYCYNKFFNHKNTKLFKHNTNKTNPFLQRLKAQGPVYNKLLPPL